MLPFRNFAPQAFIRVTSSEMSDHVSLELAPGERFLCSLVSEEPFGGLAFQVLRETAQNVGPHNIVGLLQGGDLVQEKFYSQLLVVPVILNFPFMWKGFVARDI